MSANFKIIANPASLLVCNLDIYQVCTSLYKFPLLTLKETIYLQLIQYSKPAASLLCCVWYFLIESSSSISISFSNSSPLDKTSRLPSLRLRDNFLFCLGVPLRMTSISSSELDYRVKINVMITHFANYFVWKHQCSVNHSPFDHFLTNLLHKAQS